MTNWSLLAKSKNHSAARFNALEQKMYAGSYGEKVCACESDQKYVLRRRVKYIHELREYQNRLVKSV